ncbi:hypothetical protein LX81_02553 [Palleronia aestuarii]|uniref:Uncharacterized protein n=1 Tax=Palleronia aestuarii TaxID=568105 RepID=A0A2W7N5A9_9RHOB|nr:hypothetical protein [Palleronia aestuarii]PZX15250.1 hypothetical protein LX81_02553 [Palleronia aestuarii]
MTVLEEYDRLEAPAIWRRMTSREDRDVVVSFGEATLAILDGKDRPLAHWSLPAVIRRNPGSHPARFAPGLDAREEIEIDDEPMIEAISRIQRALSRRDRATSRRRGAFLWMAGAALFAAALWAPAAIERSAASSIPPAVSDELGVKLTKVLADRIGPVCAAPQARGPLARLSRRALGQAGDRIVVLGGSFDNVITLPGGITVISSDLIEQEDDPEVVAGHILAERLRIAQTDPIDALIDHASIWSVTRLLATGETSDALIRSYVNDLLSSSPPHGPIRPLLDAFTDAGLGAAPYALTILNRDQTYATTLLESDPPSSDPARPVLSDRDWVALQSVCEG